MSAIHAVPPQKKHVVGTGFTQGFLGRAIRGIVQGRILELAGLGLSFASLVSSREFRFPCFGLWNL